MAKVSKPQFGYIIMWLVDLILTSVILIYLLSHKPSEKWKNTHKYAIVYISILMAVAAFMIIAAYMGYQPRLTLGNRQVELS